MKRKNGYYWVKVYKNDKWKIAEYKPYGWLLFACEDIFNDSSFYKIDENRIIRKENK